MKSFEKIWRGSIISGFFIGIAGAAFLKVGGIAGAVLFSFGLIGVTHYKTPLFTGTAGFVQNKKDLLDLFVILLGNILGCAVIAGAVGLCYPEIKIPASTIIQAHLESGILPQLILSILCGFIMTTAVKFARGEKYLPLLFGVPVFILSGFIHSIADAFYLFLYPDGLSIRVMLFYLTIVCGNFIGCNLYRILIIEEK